MVEFKVEIDTNTECGSESIEFPTLQDAWEEFVNQVATEQQEGYPCSADGGDGLVLKLWAVEEDTETCIFQYDNRYGADNLSLMYGIGPTCDEAIIDKDSLIDLEF